MQEPQVRGQRREAHVLADAAVGIEHGLAQTHEAEAAAAVPAHRLGNAALLAFDDFRQPRQAVGFRVIAHLDADPAAAHLVGDGRGGAGAEEAVEDEVVGVSGDVEDALEQPLGLWGSKTIFTAK